MEQKTTENINVTLIEDTIKKNDIYRLFKDNTFFKGNNPPKLKHTKSKDSNSLSSLQFDTDCLKDVFGFNCNEFCRKYTEAISGLEEDNIFTLHSSSLLALLFFCKVSPKNPISIAGQKYYHVHFEHKNPIPFESTKNGKTRKYTTNSNIDVVLSDKETLEDSEQILFLESKFTEYTHNAKQTGISKDAYSKIYNLLKRTLEDDMGLQFIDGVLSPIDKAKGHYYCEGIKQMICHFMGARKFAEDNPEKNIKLGSIIYNLSILDGPDNDNGKYSTMFNSYSGQYHNLMQGIYLGSENQSAELMLPPKLSLITNILTYQDVFKNEKNKNYQINEKVRQFYQLSKQ